MACVAPERTRTGPRPAAGARGRVAGRFAAPLLLLSLATLIAVGRPSAHAEPLAVTRGDARARLGGALTGWHVFRLDPDTPSERPSSTLDLRLDVEKGDWLRFVARGLTGFDGKVGDPDRSDPFRSLERIYQNEDLFLELDEAYLELHFRNVELGLGKQKVSWGQLDEIQPTDHVNPEDLTEFVFVPELERKIGVPALRLAGYTGPWTAEMVWTPLWVAYRFPAPEDRWFPPLLKVPERVATDFGPVPVRTRYPDVDVPPHTLASSDIALRVRRFLAGAELTATLFHGWDKNPTFSARGTATLVPTGDPQAPVVPSIDAEIFPTLHRITVVGTDLAVPIWLLALRAEAAWIHGRAFFLLIRDQVGRDPRVNAAVGAAAARVAASGRAETVVLPLPATELERDALQYGIGVDYFVPDGLSRRVSGGSRLTGAFVLLQLIETVIFDHDAPFIADQVEHLLGLTLRQSFRDQRLQAELKLGYNPGHGDFFVWPRLGYTFAPNWQALFEARVLGGDREQTIGQYREHDGIFIGLRRFL